jgi:hypothetical protein
LEAISRLAAAGGFRWQAGGNLIEGAACAGRRTISRDDDVDEAINLMEEKIKKDKTSTESRTR